MGKKSKIRTKPQKYARKYKNHPYTKYLLEKKVITLDGFPDKNKEQAVPAEKDAQVENELAEVALVKEPATKQSSATLKEKKVVKLELPKEDKKETPPEDVQLDMTPEEDKKRKPARRAPKAKEPARTKKSTQRSRKPPAPKRSASRKTSAKDPKE